MAIPGFHDRKCVFAWRSSASIEQSGSTGLIKSDAQKFRPRRFASNPIAYRSYGLFVGAPALEFISSRLETCMYGSGLKSEVNVPWLKSL
tara:strand:+ start:8017 stop:8286 length:270 start_codon:yes stop_codon:yes gene_type:complete